MMDTRDYRAQAWECHPALVSAQALSINVVTGSDVITSLLCPTDYEEHSDDPEAQQARYFERNDNDNNYELVEGLVNSNGREILAVPSRKLVEHLGNHIPEMPIFDDAFSTFHNGYASVRVTCGSEYPPDGKHDTNRAGNQSRAVFFDTHGAQLETEHEYDDALSFSEGLASVHRADAKATTGWGYIDRTGREVIPCTLPPAGIFSHGVAPILDRKGLIGFIGRDGKVLAQPCYSYYNVDRGFLNGVAIVLIGHVKSIIDTHMKAVVDRLDKIGEPYHWSDGDRMILFRGEKCGLMVNGTLTIPIEYDTGEFNEIRSAGDAQFFSPILRAQRNGRCVILRTDGRVIWSAPAAAAASPALKVGSEEAGRKPGGPVATIDFTRYGTDHRIVCSGTSRILLIPNPESHVPNDSSHPPDLRVRIESPQMRAAIDPCTFLTKYNRVYAVAFAYQTLSTNPISITFRATDHNVTIASKRSGKHRETICLGDEADMYGYPLPPTQEGLWYLNSNASAPDLSLLLAQMGEATKVYPGAKYAYEKLGFKSPPDMRFNNKNPESLVKDLERLRKLAPSHDQ